jgi:peptidoglycan LD-endopeptidase LytH
VAGHRTTARGILLTLLAAEIAVSSASAREPGQPPAKPVSKSIVFPVIGKVTYTDDYGDPRSGGRHAGNDLMAPRKSLAVAAESGRVKFWTTSSNAGCMLYLYGESGTTYLYIHLNNDLGATNDNKGWQCSSGVAYAPGLKSGDRVMAGQHIAYVGDSGDAESISPHLHFEVHPNNGGDVNPYPYLQLARRLVFAGKLGSTFSLAVTGTVVEIGDGAVEIEAKQVRQWPGSKLIKHDGLRVRLLADRASTDENTLALLQAPRSAMTQGRAATVFTATGRVTLAAQAGEPGALAATRLVFR